VSQAPTAPRTPSFEEVSALHRAGRTAEACAGLESFLRAHPEHAGAWQLAGVLAFQASALVDSEQFFRRALELEPRCAAHYGNLGILLRHVGKHAEGLEVLSKAIELDAGVANVHAQFGELLSEAGRLEEAAEHLARAVALDPSIGFAWVDLVNLFAYLNRFDEALECMRRAQEIDPATSGACAAANHRHLALAFASCERDEDAIRHLELWADLQPEPRDRAGLLAEACVSVGFGVQHSGRAETAVSWFERACALKPDDATAHSHLFWCLQYCADRTPESSTQRAIEWGRRFPAVTRPAVAPRQGRRLRIGYLSPDLRDFPAAYFIEPLLGAHDRTRVETFLYSCTRVLDDTSARLRASADHWRDVVPLSDDEAAELVRRDGIDVLVDVAGHTESNRIGIMVRRPAPVQAEWLGYYATTGLPQVDYMICGSLLLPPEEERLFIEKPMRLDGLYHSFGPPRELIPVSPLPALRNGHVTFGCDCYLAKVNPEVVKTWSQVLHAVPGSRFEMNRQALMWPGVRAYMVGLFAENGIDESRLTFIATHTREEYLRSVGRLDVLLDTFPFNGYTSILEALWAGVPVVSMSAPRMVGHFAENLLVPFGRPEWVAKTATEYVAAAKELTSDLRVLAELRAGLRERFVKSPLCDAAAFARDMETAYERMIAEACERP
jgi:predicted O-linked N-acetylglucosamine transferase (SPINDLY family)